MAYWSALASALESLFVGAWERGHLYLDWIDWSVGAWPSLSGLDFLKQLSKIRKQNLHSSAWSNMNSQCWGAGL
jgi:hypothetical protein